MVVIINYGIGNLGSVVKAVEHLGYRAQFTDSLTTINQAKKIILPGVAHFGETVKELKKRKLFTLLKEKIKECIPFLGICVGMQVLFDQSEEAKGVLGLGVVKGKVKRFKKQGLIVPHMGWNQVNYQLPITNYPMKTREQKNMLFRGVEEGSYFYFAHSYYCVPENKSVVLTTTDYGVEFVSSVCQENLWAIQFHPEKSQKAGLKVLDNFLKL